MSSRADGGYAGPFFYRSQVHLDELDLLGMLHNARYAAHVERAQVALYLHVTGRERVDLHDPDQFVVVRYMETKFLRPFYGTGTMGIDVWVEALRAMTCTLGYRCRAADGATVYARGRRTLVKRDPESLEPVRWSAAVRAALRPYVRPAGWRAAPGRVYDAPTALDLP